MSRAVPVVLAFAASLLARPDAAESRRLPTPLCLRGEGPLVLQKLQPDALEYCLEVEDGVLRCFSTDLRTGKLHTIPPPVRPTPGASYPRLSAAPSVWNLEIGEDSVQICRVDGSACKTVRASAEVDPGLGLSAALNADGTVVALSYLSDEPLVETFEVATGKRLMQVRGRNKKAMCISGSFVGESLVISEMECGSDDVRESWLASADGKYLGAAGGGKAFASWYQPAHLRGEEWAFPAARGESLVIQNVRTGKIIKRISLGKPGSAKTAATTAIADEHHAVVVHGGKRLGDLSVVDLATYKVTKVAGIRCPKK